LSKRPEILVIREVADLIEAVKKVAQKGWIFRGQSSPFWGLKASVHRLLKSSDTQQLINNERRLLNEFKRKARIFLPSPPSSDWEWLVLAQHFGLPTRLLDWTENPLVALYFSVRDQQETNDGVIYAYRHGVDPIDVQSTSDPFAIEKVELIRPPHLDQRVIVQQSVFTAEPPLYDRGGRDESDLRYWYVSVGHKSDIRRELEMLGVSESSIFPGLSSVAAHIKEQFLSDHPQDARETLPVARRTKPRVARASETTN
jgi:FRG domain